MTIDSLRPDADPASGLMVEVTDPPEHRRLRRSIGAFFADGAVVQMEPAARKKAIDISSGASGPAQARSRTDYG